MKNLSKRIREIPDFPKKGILFRDITPLLSDGKAFREVIEIFKNQCPEGIEKVVAVESRGFIFGSCLAYSLGVGFVPVRKAGKLPYKTLRVEYDLEYGKDVLEMHEDGISKGEKVVVVDDLLATGGTALACCQLVEKCGGKVEKILFLIELAELKGIEKLKGYDVFSILKL